MCQVNMYQAKTEFSKLVAMLERGEEEEVIVCRDGVPVARIEKILKSSRKGMFGCAKDKMHLPENFWDDFDSMDSEIAEDFGV